ncbi:hypothetical protein KIPB_014408, partial [Kipferlia bialata]
QPDHTEFVMLREWLRDQDLTARLRRIPLFRLHRKAKAFRLLKLSVARSKMDRASAVLKDRLFMLDANLLK